MADEIRALPGVVEVGIGSDVPLAPSLLNMELKVAGKPLSAASSLRYLETKYLEPETVVGSAAA